MTTEKNSDKQGEPRLLSEAELKAVAGGDSGTAAGVHALAEMYQWLRLPPPAPDPCRD